ncbi:MAG: hypothetical protein M1817_006188 [Caeruleum heppii]|nr:MAG: hypothetical protein M1817_006188 [Caeruleum heppii]
MTFRGRGVPQRTKPDGSGATTVPMAAFADSNFSYTSYASFRPVYPQSLYDSILRYHTGPRTLLIDLGCGHGVACRSLAPHFTTVIGTDPSAGMIEQARSSTSSPTFPNVTYREAAAEDLPFVRDGPVDMVVAGLAAHWFDLDRLWAEMARILRPDGTLAFWGYRDPVFVSHPGATGILERYTHGSGPDRLGDYWIQPGRARMQHNYRDIIPPESGWKDVQRWEYEPGTSGPRSGEGECIMSQKTTLGGCMAFFRTWSSVHRWMEDHPERRAKKDGGAGDVVDEMFAEMRAVEESWREAEGWEKVEVEIEWGSAVLLARRRD